MKTISLQEAVAMVPLGATLMIGGFMGVGSPEPIIDELVRQQKRELTVIANDTAKPGAGIGKLVSARLLSRAIVSHIGLNPETQQQMMTGELQVDLVPQGTLVERIRAGGFGLGGILTPTGVGTVVEEGSAKSPSTAATTCSRPRCGRTSRLYRRSSPITWKPRIRAYGPQLQPAHGDGRKYRVGAGGERRARWRHCARPRGDAGSRCRLPCRGGVRPWTRKRRSQNALPANYATACWSTWKSAYRPSSPIMCLKGCTCSFIPRTG